MKLAHCDYLIVGGGSAGCVLAARLSANPHVTVLLLEAGPDDRGFWKMQMPLAWRDTFMDPRVNWGYTSEPEPHADGRIINAPRGKVLGGCSSVNGMMYSRGAPQDFDAWAAAGCTGWSHAEVLPYFRRAETNWRGASEHHGGDGPLTTSRNHPEPRLFAALLARARELGLPVTDDFHGAQHEGFSTPDFNVHRGRRASTSARYLNPVRHRPNLKVVTDTQALRVVFEGKRAVGVECLQQGKPTVLRADREVVLAAGAFGSPQLLLLSGVGPAAEITAHGLRVHHELPGVGRNLQDHQSCGAMYEVREPITFERELRIDRLLWSVLRWQFTGGGPIGGLPVNAQGFVRLRPEATAPELQMLVSPVSMLAKPWFPGWRKGAGHVITVANVLLHPESRGQVTLRSADPLAAPRIQLRLLSAERDRETFRLILRFTREFLGEGSGLKLLGSERLPGKAVQTDAELDAYVRKFIGTAWHPTSTCAMGTGPEAVVDPQLRVRGLDGLRIADASIMPTIVGGNTNAAAIMIGEKASDLLLQT
jgi:choline dehydrogenase